MLIDFIKAVLVGLGGSIPLGPIGVLCIQRTLNKGRISGFVSGTGAAVADTIFAAFAILGLAVVQRLIENNQHWFMLVGGLILVALGARIYFTNPIVQLRKNKTRKGRFLEDFVSVFFLTLTNPATIFFLLGLFALVQLDMTGKTSNFNIGLVLWGVFIGAGLWWFTLTSLVNKFRRKFRLKQLWIINRVSGIIIFVMGIIAAFQGVWDLIFHVLKHKVG